jgi:hypothetical protein
LLPVAATERQFAHEFETFIRFFVRAALYVMPTLLRSSWRPFWAWSP